MLPSLSTVVDIVVFSPLVCFVAAGILEVKHRQRDSIRILAIVAIALGIAMSVLLVIPLSAFSIGPATSARLSLVMTVISLLVAGSGILGKFNSKVTSVLTVLGGTTLAFFWLFNRVIF